ncbi:MULTISPECIES: N-acetylmuramoyl-L-alanine amidase [Enterococcus]|uniref:N-acetylmuramoyl-L-alanine amidase n=1 Tax=Enterococcus entomosocium TaxID=3034352 RepID=A0ABV3MDG0_9ENTE|nr:MULTISPECIES: N-acetylmuramoyl-L-alanine amidase [Enterococcus]OTO96535.1 hypothetical protein A5852_002502 [Enterococcus faecium]MDB1718101.1 N-acetylmuramoyl-L-alanine amidase [Enterococcus casseliflavus]MEC5316862.1 N-acetylmuramoyl-L-alanine amidase [Enterococcus casseliflavus]OTO12360.1 hypothetical protein A5882_000747 [Enterococcus sp. 4E1_DIV0656]WEI92562.1 N-acetylmuramoyl-L-alanine amidase [Enterococcus casseliflavus]
MKNCEKLNVLIESYALTNYDTGKAELVKGNAEMIYLIMNLGISSTFGPHREDFH